MSDALLPVIVAELDADARRSVEQMAASREVAWVPLLEAPVDASLHVLEVVSPSGGEPLLLLAEPLGAPTELGFPLRIHPFDSPPQSRSLMPPGAAELPKVQATRRRPGTLSRRHTRDLEGMLGGAVVMNEDSWIGREIAGGKLVIEELVGHGGMGEVYRARHKHLGRHVAVKMLHARFKDDLLFCSRFHAEALAISALDHPGLVRIVDYGQEEDGTLYLAMDFVEGRELEELIRERESLSHSRIVEIGMQIAAGLGHAHARGIVHRDVKPSNVLLVKRHDDDGRLTDVVKVCDFGIATSMGSGEPVGTPAYMSPEQIQAGEIDGRSDVYSLGIVLYELAAGQLPFPGDDPQKVLAGHLERNPLAPSLIRPIDARLEALVMRMLQKDPQNRPSGMREVRAMLRDTLRPISTPDLLPVGSGRGERDAPPVSTKAVVTPDPPRTASSQHMPAFVDPTPLAAQMAAEPMTVLRERLATLESFTRDAQKMAAAMRLLLKRNDIAPLAQIVIALAKVVSDPADPRADLAMRVVRSLADPALLAPLAEHVLLEHDEVGPSLLAALGLASAHALYAGRARLTATSPVRGRFVATLRAIGAPAVPLIVAAIDKNVPENAPPLDSKIAEDLLRALPASNDESVGARVARCLRWGDAPLRRAAIPALVTVWGDRARALLLGIVSKDTDEGSRIAAVRGLQKLHAFDEHLVRKCESFLAEPTIELRLALADALADVPPDCKPLAAEIVKKALGTKGVLGILRKGPAMPPEVTIALEKTLRTLSS